MFSLDVTFFFQIAHFLLAYWFIKKFLFSQLIAEIKQEDAVLQGLHTKLDLESKNFAQALSQQQQARDEIHKNYKQQIPAELNQSVEIPEEIEKIESSEPEFQELTPEREKELVARITDYFIKRTVHE